MSDEHDSSEKLGSDREPHQQRVGDSPGTYAFLASQQESRED
jgi:hypothetical protein